MPYITCKDGHTYSRADKSFYVKQCIKERNEHYAEMYAKCQSDPVCRKEREFNDSVVVGVMIFGCALMLYLFYYSFKAFK